MATKNKKSGGRNKPHGHFCKVCGEHKANEKFSGKGHTAHICKQCAALPVPQRNEMMAVRKIEGMAFRHLNESEIKWLRNQMDDSRPAVRDAAIEAHGIKFPRYERNMAKKGLTAFSLELFVHDRLYDDFGDEADVHALVTAKRSGLFRCIDYTMPEGEQKTEIQIEPKEANRFLKSVVQTLDAPFWDEDYSDEEYSHDPYLDILPEYLPNDDDCDEDEPEEAPAEIREPRCSLHLELNSGEDKKIVFYNTAPDAAAELFWLLMEYFELDEDEEID